MKLTELQEKEFFAHLPTKISKELNDYVIDQVLRRSRYIFTKRDGAKRQWGYCTHCKRHYLTDNYKHNKVVYCKHCESECTVKDSGRGRKYLADDAYLVWYEKSLIDPEAITARGLYVRRDYSGGYHNVQTDFSVQVMYFFKPGECRMIEPSWGGGWKERKSVFSISNSVMQHKRSHYSRGSIASAVKGTMFQYSQWEHFYHEDMVKFFALYAKYPCIEYLTKLGLSNLVNDKLVGLQMYRSINWRGKTLHKVLKVTKQELKTIKDLREMNYSVDAFMLHLFQQSKRDGSNISMGEAYQLNTMIPNYYYEELQKLQRYATIGQIYHYMKKQYYGKSKKQFSRPQDVLTTWKDYLADCRKLEMDLNQEGILYPTNLYKAHQETIKRVKYKEDQELNKKIEERLKVLEALTFTFKGLLIRPAKSTLELIEEGNALNHCVGGYAKRYANGETNLFFIRKLNMPDKPFYTIEIKNNTITQAYGNKNVAPTKQVEKFIDHFKAEKLAKKSKKEKVIQTA
ncbi:hypothetical protein BKP37_00650 [Anaerobacillus alkalilacustris]|uniref:PcfJ-like protein n=1 Tax=Anaerobacillus alkalilacustris TaxID=393763 RepID=A0A1S2LY14_9BACI|nr:PcfJ domain-containing protein [Anaerobacillus alkalilacustris]OIJ17083.1 hypothetical protein BKP37_00650 [Anaerobacillus alkalilacustris]